MVGSVVAPVVVDAPIVVVASVVALVVVDAPSVVVASEVAVTGAVADIRDATHESGTKVRAHFISASPEG
ncbi:hypothetical protein MTO96_041221 [Rhipicephalus appendiculatus]